MSEYTCVKKYWPKGASQWQPKPVCGKPATYWVDMGGPADLPMCTIHARVAQRDGRKVRAIGAADSGKYYRGGA